MWEVAILDSFILQIMLNMMPTKRVIMNDKFELEISGCAIIALPFTIIFSFFFCRWLFL